MKKNKAVRGLLHGKIKRVVITRDGRVVETIPFDEVVESVKSRSSREPRETETQVAVCIESDDPQRLIIGKLYKINFLTDESVRVIDESGEPATHSIDCFIPLAFPPNIEERLMRVLA